MKFSDIKQKIAIDLKKNIPENVVELPYLKRKAVYRPMKNREMKEFLKAFEKKDEFLISAAFDAIIESCLHSIDGESIDAKDLCTPDRQYLLLKIRQASLGDIAKIYHAVENRPDPIELEVDLNSFAVVYKNEVVRNEIEITENVKMVLGLATRRDELEMEAWLKKSANKNSIIDRSYSSAATLIKEVYIKTEDGEWENVSINFFEKVQLLSDVCTPNTFKEIKELSQ